MDFSNIYKKVSSSVVNIIQVDSSKNCQSFATGVIVGDGSKVLTCSHCVSSIYVNAIYLRDTNQYLSGTIMFNDVKSDIAILDMGRVVGTASRIISSSGVEVGNEVFTVGFPYDFAGEKTLTSGHIAAFEDDLIKIDTSVNNGNSGGALFNDSGEIIGIINAKLGRLSKFLEQIEQYQPQAFMTISGVDPVSVIQQMIKEMKLNLNLGIGYAIPTDIIAKKSTFIQSIII